MSSRGGNTDTIMAAIKGTADAVGRLLSAHAKLIRLELREDVQKLGRYVAGLAVVALFGILGYAVVILGIAACFAPRFGWAAPLLILGLLHIGGAALIGWKTLQGLQSFSPLDDTTRITKGSVATLAHPTQGMNEAHMAHLRESAEAGNQHG